MENISTWRPINTDEIEEINRLANNAEKTLGIISTDSIEEKLTKMNLFIKNFTVEKRYSNDELEKYAYEFGSLFGNLIQQKHHWEWLQVEADEEIYFCITSPKQRACCVCHNYIYSILNCSHSNNFKLLFNMIKNQYPKEWYFMVLS